jgi:hypothetical protein
MVSQTIQLDYWTFIWKGPGWNDMESPDSGHGYSPHGKGKFAPSRSLGFFQATPCYSQFNKDLDLINLNYILPIDAFWCLLLHEVQHAAFSRPLAESSRLLLWWRGPDRHADTLKSGWQLQTGHILVNTCPIIIIRNDLQCFFFLINVLSAWILSTYIPLCSEVEDVARTQGPDFLSLRHSNLRAD